MMWLLRSPVLRMVSDRWWSKAMWAPATKGRLVVMSSGDGDFPILHVLWMDEQDFIDHVEVLQQHRAHQTVEVAARHQTIFFCFRHGIPQLDWTLINDTTQSHACPAIV